MLDAGHHIQDDIDRRGGKGIDRIPRFARRIENRIAADEYVVIGALAESGRRAELHPVGMFHDFRVRIDAYNTALFDSWTDLRDGEIKFLGDWIPYRLLGAVRRVHAVGQVKGEPVRPGACRLGEYASLRIELDERVERNQTAGGVSYKEAICRRRDAVRARPVVAASEPGESPAKLRDQDIGRRVDDVDDLVGAIGKKVSAARLVDPADVKRVETFCGCIPGRRWDRNSNEKPDGPVVLLRSPVVFGPHGMPAEVEGQGQ